MKATQPAIAILASLVTVLGGCATQHAARPLPQGPQDLQVQLTASIRALSVDIGERHMWKPANLERAALWIEEQFQSSGLCVRRQEYRAGGDRYDCRSASVRNLVVEVPGTTRSNEILVIGAHYDSRVAMPKWNAQSQPLSEVKGTPGADDNASGVAALLVLARHFATHPQERTLRFVAFVNEEPPFFTKPAMGSYVYARECRENGDDIKGMLSLECLGRWSRRPAEPCDHPDAGDPVKVTCPPKRNWFYSLFAPVFALPKQPDYVAFLSNWGSAGFAVKAARIYQSKNSIAAHAAVVPVDFLCDRLSWSDDWAFWQFGYPACSVTDTAYLRNEDYHELGDTLERLDIPQMAAVVRGLVPALENLSNGPWDAHK